MEYALFYQALKGQINRFIALNTQPELKHESMFRCWGGGGGGIKELDLRSDMQRRGTLAVLMYLYRRVRVVLRKFSFVVASQKPTKK
jgi:hypothetical protein